MKSIWNKLSPAIRTQIGRAILVFITTFGATLSATETINKSVLVAATSSAALVAWRSFRPATLDAITPPQGK